MNAYLFAAPRFRPLSPSGAILPGAYIQFYESGTTTPADVYADADLATPLSHPVTADASGEFVAIYLDPSVTYRAQLYDPDDTLLWDIDPLAPPRDYAPGTVLMFFGTQQQLEAAYPPALWQVLDGNNGAPDIRDRFPIGVSASLSPGDTGGGSGLVNTSAAGGHNHGGATSAVALTLAQTPEHSHGLRTVGGGGGIVDGSGLNVCNAVAGVRNVSPGGVQTDGIAGLPYVETKGSGETHDHSISAVGDHVHQVDVTPPYVALWFIMRRAA